MLQSKHICQILKSLNAECDASVHEAPKSISSKSFVPHTPEGPPPPLTPELQTPIRPRQKLKTPPDFASDSPASNHSTPSVLRSPEEPIDYGPLVPIKNANQYEREYYVIPNYRNIFGTENLLAVAKSTIRNAGLGLFAVLRSNEKISKDQIVFAFHGEEEPNPIDEYKGKIIHHPNEKKWKNFYKIRIQNIYFKYDLIL